MGEWTLYIKREHPLLVIWNSLVTVISLLKLYFVKCSFQIIYAFLDFAMFLMTLNFLTTVFSFQPLAVSAIVFPNWKSCWTLYQLILHSFWFHVPSTYFEWKTQVFFHYTLINVKFSSSSSSCIGLLSVAAPQIWLIHLFLGWPRLLFPVGLYDNM